MTTANETIDAYYAALKSGDADAIKAVVAADIAVVYHDTTKTLPWSGTYQGCDAFIEFLASVGAALSIDAVTPIARYVTEETVIVVLDGAWTAKATGRQMTARVANVFTIRDGKVARYEVFPDSAAFAVAIGTLKHG